MVIGLMILTSLNKNFVIISRTDSKTRAQEELCGDVVRINPLGLAVLRSNMWGCGEDKSPGPDGFTFEFFRKYWAVVGPDFSIAVEWFFKHGDFAIECSSSLVALIPKVLDPKVVSDYRPINVETAFLPNR
ncbi:hypothetical protein Tco_0903177, partial [Tanacetum coccineum]